MRCPVSSLEKYIGKLNPNCESFGQRPKRNSNDSNAVWYYNYPAGHNTLGNFMKTISLDFVYKPLHTCYVYYKMCK